jgi:hypothetical protein
MRTPEDQARAANSAERLSRHRDPQFGPRQDKKVRIGNLGAGLQFSRKPNIKAAWFARKVDLLGRA